MHRSRFMSDRAGRASGLFGFSRIIKLITVQLPVTCVLLRPTVLFLQLPIQRSSTLVGYNPRWKSRWITDAPLVDNPCTTQTRVLPADVLGAVVAIGRSEAPWTQSRAETSDRGSFIHFLVRGFFTMLWCGSVPFDRCRMKSLSDPFKIWFTRNFPLGDPR